MKQRVWSAERFPRLKIAAGLLLLIACAVGLYRAQTPQHKDSLVRIHSEIITIPAGTHIQVVIRNRVAKSADIGDSLTAFVTSPVVLKGATVIPIGAQIQGKLEELSVQGSDGKATISFKALRLDGHNFPIQTQQIVAKIPVQSDTAILGSALRVLAGAGLGVALGAVSGDPNLINRAMFQGALPSISNDMAVPLTVVLTRDLNFAEQLPS